MGPTLRAASSRFCEVASASRTSRSRFALMVRVATWPSDSSPGMGGVSREGVSKKAEITETVARHDSASRARKRGRLSRRCQRVGSALAVIRRQAVYHRLPRSLRFLSKARWVLPGGGFSSLLLGLGEGLFQRPLGIRILLRLRQLAEDGELLLDHVARGLALGGEDLRLQAEDADLALAAGHLGEGTIHRLLGLGELLLLEVHAGETGGRVVVRGHLLLARGKERLRLLRLAQIEVRVHPVRGDGRRHGLVEGPLRR